LYTFVPWADLRPYVDACESPPFVNEDDPPVHAIEADFPRAEVLWLVKRLERSEYERGQMKAENRRLLRRLRKLRHKRHH